MSKASIYLGPWLQRALAHTRDGNRSARIDTIAERYMQLVEDAMPELSQAEWLAIMDANYDKPVGTQAWANLAETPGLGNKYDIDQGRLTLLLMRLPRHGRIAVAEVIERFGAQRRLHPEGSAAEVLKTAGARIKR